MRWMQNEMRGILGRVSAGAAGRILDSANPEEIRAQQKSVSVATKTRENTASVTPEPTLPKRKGTGKGKGPEHQIVKGERVKVSKSPTLARERRIRAGAWRGKSGLHNEGRQVPRRKGKASKKASIGEVGGSMSR